MEGRREGSLEKKCLPALCTNGFQFPVMSTNWFLASEETLQGQLPLLTWGRRLRGHRRAGHTAPGSGRDELTGWAAAGSGRDEDQASVSGI